MKTKNTAFENASSIIAFVLTLVIVLIFNTVISATGVTLPVSYKVYPTIFIEDYAESYTNDYKIVSVRDFDGKLDAYDSNGYYSCFDPADGFKVGDIVTQTIIWNPTPGAPEDDILAIINVLKER